MNLNLEDFFYFEETDKTDDELRNMIHEMIDILDNNQLRNIINILKEPYYLKALDTYTLSNELPDLKSQELLFLIQAVKYSGNIVRKLVREAKVSDYNLDKYILKYGLVEVSRGIYLFPNKEIDAQFLFQSQYTRSVISHETALYMHDLSDVIPKRTIMSIPEKYNFSQIEKNESMFIRIDEESYNKNKVLRIKYENNDPIYIIKNSPIGNTQINILRNSYNNEVRVTSKERTISDIFKSNSTVEEEVKEEALKKYYKQNPHDDKKLLMIAKKQGVEHDIKNYLWKLQLY